MFKFWAFFLIPALAIGASTKKPKVKNYLTSIGELCEKSNGCKIESVPKNMKINVGNRSLLVLNDRYERLEGNCIEKRYCKIVIKNEPPKN